MSARKHKEGMTGVYKITLRAPDGQERNTLVWFPNEQTKQDYYDKARKRGLEITEQYVELKK